MFEIVLSQFAFAKRTWWCLSSLAQQENPPCFKVKLQIHVSDPYAALNQKLIQTFRRLVDLRVVEWREDEFFRRGYTRSLDLKSAFSFPWRTAQSRMRHGVIMSVNNIATLFSLIRGQTRTEAFESTFEMLLWGIPRNRAPTRPTQLI